MLATASSFGEVLAAFLLFAKSISGSVVHSTNHKPNVQISTLWEFSLGTWVENLAVRPNGQILASDIFSPSLYLVDPTGAHAATLVHSFPNVSSVMGIAEVPHGSDVFYLAAGNAFVAQEGSWAVWRIDMTTFKYGGSGAEITKFVSVPEWQLPNGLTALGNKFVLLADSFKSVIWRIDTESAEAVEINTDPLLAPSANSSVGVNGIKVRNHKLYWSNTARGIIASVPIRHNGTAITSATIALSNATGIDDFFFNGHDFLLAGSNEVRKVGRGGKQVALSNSILLAGSTAIVPAGACEPNKAVFYITTNGGAAQYYSGNFTSPGKVLRMQLG